MPRRSSRPAPRAGRRARAGRSSDSAFETAVECLARRAHSRAELWRKLRRRGYEAAELEEAMSRLADLGYLDDARFAAGHVRRRSAKLGPLALAAELAARGVERDVLRGAIAQLSREDQLASAVRLVALQAARRRPAGYKELLDTAGARLLRRGFSLGLAREACRQVWLGTVATSEA